MSNCMGYYMLVSTSGCGIINIYTLSSLLKASGQNCLHEVHDWVE